MIAEAALAEAIAALEEADAELAKYSFKGMTTRQAFAAMQDPAYFMPKRAAESKRDAASRAVTAARIAARREQWQTMLAETADILPKLRAEYAAAEDAWLAGDALKDEGAFSGQQYFRMDDAHQKLHAVEHPLNELRWQIRWAEGATEYYAAWLAAEMEKDSLEQTDLREARADRMEEKQRQLDYRPPWEGLG